MPPPEEPRNPLYLLLLALGLLFIFTVLACAIVPVLEQKALDMGEPVPPSPFRKALQRDGLKWVLYQVGALVVVGLMSMGLDRFRRWKQEQAAKPPGPPTEVE